MSPAKRKSYSTHNVTWGKRNTLNKCTIPLDDNGILHVPMKGFCSWGTYDSQLDKLCYILQMCVYTNGVSVNTSNTSKVMSSALETLYNSEEFLQIEDTLKSYVGNNCTGVRFVDGAEYGYIDDTVYSSVQKFLDKFKTDLLEFIFGEATLCYEYNG